MKCFVMKWKVLLTAHGLHDKLINQISHLQKNGSGLMDLILRRQNHLCVPISPTSSGRFSCQSPPWEYSPCPGENDDSKGWEAQPMRHLSLHLALDWVRLWILSAWTSTAFLLTLCCLLSPDKQKESLIHEDNSRVTDLKCASDQNQNQFYSVKQSLVHTELQTVSTFLKELLARWDYKAVELMFISRWEWVHLYDTDIFVTHSDTAHLIKK